MYLLNCAKTNTERICQRLTNEITHLQGLGPEKKGQKERKWDTAPLNIPFSADLIFDTMLMFKK